MRHHHDTYSGPSTGKFLSEEDDHASFKTPSEDPLSTFSQALSHRASTVTIPMDY